MSTIRLCKPEDATAVAAVARQTWNATYAGLIPEEVQAQALAQLYDADRLAARAAAGQSTFLVAVDDGERVIGYVSAAHRTQSADAELFAIYVLPEHHGSGTGARLLADALRLLKAKGPVHRLFVQVERDNRVGRSFYDRKGFVAVREYEEDFFGHRSAMVEMCLTVEG